MYDSAALLPLQASLLSPNPAIDLFAVLFGSLWILTNFYQFYPLVQTAVERVAAYLRGGTTSTEPPPLPDGGRPTIDVLLAAYDEPAVVHQAIRSTVSADYPADRLQLTVLLEPGDEPTHEAVDSLRETHDFDVLTVPAAYPGDPNKPRALNYGYEHTDGDVVGVIDAEDFVAPEAFDEVARAMADGADFAQGRLDMANEDDGWLNLLFRAEYGYWYNVVTPAFARVGYPVPMAGTTCFFRRSVLVAASDHRLDTRGDPWDDADQQWVEDHGLAGVRPWDPQNVTEDFELGLLLWELDYEFAYLETVTTEESPPTLDGWLGQRTRWKKGKVYTMLDRREHPPDSRRDRLHVYWQSLLPHLGPINVAGLVILFLVANLAKYRPGPLLGAVLALGGTFALVTGVCFGLGYFSVTDTSPLTRIRRTVLAVVTLPLYWLLQWGADIRALVQTYGGQFHWEHTDHVGQDSTETASDPEAVTRRQDRLTLPRYKRWGALALVVVIAAMLRFYVLGGWSLWTDELYSVVVRGGQPAADLLVSPRDPHPPLYYLLLHWWMSAFGTEAVAVRLLSVLFGVLTPVAVYALGTELFDDRTGLLAALLVAVSTFAVHFSRVARMYSLLVFLTAVSWYWFARLRDGSRLSTAGYVLATGALVYTHVYGLFVLAAQLVYVALSEVDGGVRPWRWARVQAALAVVVLPWLVLFASRVLAIVFGSGGSNIEWIPEPSATLLTQTAVAFVGFPDFYPLLAGSLGTYLLAAALLCVYVGSLSVAVVRFDTDGLHIADAGSVGQLVALLLVPTLVPVVVSLIVPIYVPRYAAPASVALFVLAARGLRNVPRPRVRQAFLGVMVLSSLVLVGSYYTADSAEPWNNVAVGINAEADADDVVIHQPGNGYAAYYYDSAPFELTTLPSAARLSTGDLEYLGRLSREYDDVYLVQYYGSEGPGYAHLVACNEIAVTRRTGVIAVHRFTGATDCPTPSNQTRAESAVALTSE